MVLTDSNNPISYESPRPNSWAFQFALCLAGPLFFFSYFLSLLCPLPLLYLHQGNSQRRHTLPWFIFASILGVLLCAIIVGKWGALSYGVIAVFPALIMGELLQRKLGPTLAVFISFLGLIILSLVILIAYAKSIHLTPKEALQQFLQSHSSAIEKILQNSSNPENVEELKKLITVESFPGLLLSSALLLCSLPCIALIRWNPKGFLRRNNIPRDFLRKWKVPDWFVWVALFCGAFLVFDAPIASIVAENIYFSIVIIYFFQGMSILAFFLDSLRLRGPIRVLFYGAGIFFLTPIIVSFGFFDLWFNFRGRKKAEEGEP